jgi:hypothetical protein
MTVLTFPTNPTLGQLYNAPNQIRYVYDGVKWIVETVASTSLAVTNSVQDRVAPMFVSGPNTGIAFNYNAATNVMSAAVTTVNGDTLVNGVHEFTLESNGTLSLDGDPFVITSDSLVNSASSFSMSSDGTLTLTHPPESDPIVHPLSTVLTVQKAAGNYHTISGAYGLSLQATPVPSGYGLNTNTNFVDIFHDGISVNVNDNSWAFGTDGVLTLPLGGDIVDSTGTTVLGGTAGLAITDFGRGFANTLDSGKITTNKLYNRPENLALNNHYELGVTNGGVVTLPDGSIINGATLKTVPGNYAGITAGPASPAGKDEDSWMWVDNNGATISTKTSTDNHTWTFDNNGDLNIPPGGTIRDAMTGDDRLRYYDPDDTDHWNEPAINTISAALDELAARVTAFENYEIDGGNAYTPAVGELLIDGNGA